LTEEHRLRVFESRVLRRIFELKRKEVKGRRRKFYNEDLHDCIPHDQIQKEISEACDAYG
jgi:hypothetical protein